MTSWARPGVKVVCVDADDGARGHVPLVVGREYEIERVVHCVLGFVGVHLVGVHYDHAPGFFSFRFRPLVTKTQDQDVAMFLHLLTKHGVDA